MANFKKIARRSFLIGTAAIAGGVAFGVYYSKKSLANPLTPREGEATLNPYVLIDQAGVTIIAPRAEMGQGTRTTLAALVAEELDLAWEDIRVLHGPPAQAYYNTALMGAALPYPDYRLTNFQRTIGDSLNVVTKALQVQVTGGSTAMIDAYEKMRHAGASARETLKEAAAQKWGIDRADLKTEDGKVIAPDGATLTYMELAAEAAAISPPSVELRAASDWKYLGKSMPRVDMLGKSTGTATFSLDVRPEGLKFAALRINPHLGGGMTRFDAADAMKMKGVEGVFDMGDGIAVVANNTWIAMQAAEAVSVDWEDSPHPADMDAIKAKLAGAFDGKANSEMRSDGDASQVPEGATLVEAEYSVPYLAHATMEPMNATALFEGDALTIWAGLQAPVRTRTVTAEETGLAEEAVTIYTTLMGGGFGRRGESDFAIYAARLAKQMKGTPVQLTWSREEDMTHDFYRPIAMARYRGAVKDGKAVMLDGQVAAQSAAAQAAGRLLGVSPSGPDKATVEGAFDQPYAIENYRLRGYLAELDLPVGFWRSVGSSQNAFMFDGFMDEMAHAAGADPLEFRYNMMKDEHAPSAGTLAAVREMSGWTGTTPDGVGRGVAFNFSFGTAVATVIEVVDLDGAIKINKAWIACDVGTVLDPSIVEAQMFGGMMYGLSAAMFGEITFDQGAAEQQNFPDYDAVRMQTAPKEVEVRVLATNEHMGGAGEPGTPPAMSALPNAIFDLTGKRARALPLMHEFDLLT